MGPPLRCGGALADARPEDRSVFSEYLALLAYRISGREDLAEQHLYELYHRIAAKKSSGIAVVAVARELVGFLRAVMRDPENEQAAPLSEAA